MELFSYFHFWLFITSRWKYTDFCMLILYSATLLSSLLVLWVFFAVGYLRSSMCKIISSTKKERLLFPFLSDCAFSLSFCYLIALARSVSTTLDRSVESGHPRLVLYFRGNASCSSALNIMFSVGAVLIFACQVASIMSNSLGPHGP